MTSCVEGGEGKQPKLLTCQDEDDEGQNGPPGLDIVDVKVSIGRHRKEIGMLQAF